jgi:hypothetical protein
MSHVSRLGNIDTNRNSVSTDLLASTSRSNKTVYRQFETFLPFLDLGPVQYHDGPVLIVAITDCARGHDTSLCSETSHSATYILLLLSPCNSSSYEWL